MGTPTADHDSWDRFHDWWSDAGSRRVTASVAVASTIGLISSSVGATGLLILSATLAGAMAGYLFPLPGQQRSRNLSGSLALVAAIVAISLIALPPTLQRALGEPSALPIVFRVNAILEDNGTAPAQEGPLTVLAIHNVYDACSGAPGWRVPVDRNGLGPPPLNDADLGTWVRARHGQEVSGVQLTLDLHATTDAAIIVNKIEAQVLSKKNPGRGLRVVPWHECGGPGNEGQAVLKLDDVPALLYPAEETAHGIRQTSKIALTNHPFQVSLANAATLIVYALTDRRDYEWRLLMHWSTSDGVPRTTVISDKRGTPFVTVPIPSGRAVTPDPYQRVWR